MTDSLPTPWVAAQTRSLLQQRGHAWLLAGPSGLGQYKLALALARAWLCERPSEEGACNQCGSCHAIDVRTHADLCVLMPETTMLELAWPLSEKAQGEIDDKKRKASKEVRVDAMRDAVEFAQRTSARGRGKVVLVYPAERMNNVTANALLKTLEEPPGDARFVLATEAADQLLPTIRSRCLVHNMLWPSEDLALNWLQQCGIAREPGRVMLRAAGGRPEDALQFSQWEPGAQAWVRLPKAMARGDTTVFKDWTPTQALNALHKICHDVLALQSGATPRFFEAADLPTTGSLANLTAWARSLATATRTVEHPFNSGLMLEALACQAQKALN